jgi:hypothetical protein
MRYHDAIWELARAFRDIAYRLEEPEPYSSGDIDEHALELLRRAAYDAKRALEGAGR